MSAFRNRLEASWRGWSGWKGVMWGWAVIGFLVVCFWLVFVVDDATGSWRQMPLPPLTDADRTGRIEGGWHYLDAKLPEGAEVSRVGPNSLPLRFDPRVQTIAFVHIQKAGGSAFGMQLTRLLYPGRGGDISPKHDARFEMGYPMTVSGVSELRSRPRGVDVSEVPCGGRRVVLPAWLEGVNGREIDQGPVPSSPTLASPSASPSPYPRLPQFAMNGLLPGCVCYGRFRDSVVAEKFDKGLYWTKRFGGPNLCPCPRPESAKAIQQPSSWLASRYTHSETQRLAGIHAGVARTHLALAIQDARVPIRPIDAFSTTAPRHAAPLYVTMLRDPLRRFASEFRHMYKTRRTWHLNVQLSKLRVPADFYCPRRKEGGSGGGLGGGSGVGGDGGGGDGGGGGLEDPFGAGYLDPEVAWERVTRVEEAAEAGWEEVPLQRTSLCRERVGREFLASQQPGDKWYGAELEQVPWEEYWTIDAFAHCDAMEHTGVNRMVRLLALDAGCRPREWSTRRWHGYLLERAKAALVHAFVFVGIEERMQESELLLERSLNVLLDGFAAPFQDEATTQLVNSLSPQTRRLLEEATWADRELYDFATQLFDRRLAWVIGDKDRVRAALANRLDGIVPPGTHFQLDQEAERVCGTNPKVFEKAHK